MRVSFILTRSQILIILICLIILVLLEFYYFLIGNNSLLPDSNDAFYRTSRNKTSPNHANLTTLILNEIYRLIRLDVPVVEDLSDSFMEKWIEQEKIFCQNKTDPPRLNVIWRNYKPCVQSCSNPNQPDTRRIVAIVPYRDRKSHLVKLIPELVGNDAFNKGILMNAGFVEALNYIPFHCAIFHDVDLLPLNANVSYQCTIFPKHISLFIDKFQNRLPYLELIGGILSIPFKVFLRVNGFSNLFWNWGAEDDDMHERLVLNGLPIIRPDPDSAKFTMLKHKTSPAFDTALRSQILSFTRARYRLDGLNSLNYSLIETLHYDFNSNGSSNSWSEFPILHLKYNVGDPPDWTKSKH